MSRKVWQKTTLFTTFFWHPSLVYIAGVSLNFNLRYCHSCLKDNSKVPFLHDLALLKVTFATSCQLSDLLFSSMRISNLRRERSSQSASQQSDQIWYFSSHFDSNKTRQGLHGCDSTHHWVRGEHRRVGFHTLPSDSPSTKLFDKQDDGQAEFPLIGLIGNFFCLTSDFGHIDFFCEQILPNNIGNIYNIWPLNPKTNLLIRFWNGHPCSGWGATKKTGGSATCKLQEAEIKVTVKQYLKKHCMAYFTWRGWSNNSFYDRFFQFRTKSVKISKMMKNIQTLTKPFK